MQPFRQISDAQNEAPPLKRTTKKVSSYHPKFLGRTPPNVKSVDPKDYPTRDPKFIGNIKKAPRKKFGK